MVGGLIRFIVIGITGYVVRILLFIGLFRWILEVVLDAINFIDGFVL